MTLHLRCLIVLIAVVSSCSAIPATAEDETGFDGFVQSGTCAAPSGDIHLDVETGDNDHAFQIYTAKNMERGNTDVYFGTRAIPGFGPLTLLGDASFSMAIIDAAGAEVACGEITVPKESAFIDQGLILIELQAINDSQVAGVAILRAPDQGATDILTKAEVILIVGNTSAATPVAEATPHA